MSWKVARHPEYFVDAILYGILPRLSPTMPMPMRTKSRPFHQPTFRSHG
jgi:hypothetical protein